jgi:quercetin dioxygenase-like cupin family protein
VEIEYLYAKKITLYHLPCPGVQQNKETPIMYKMKNAKISFDAAPGSELQSVQYNASEDLQLKTKEGKVLSFSTVDKPHFKATGEDVVEVSGLATDKNPDISWAIVTFDPAGASSRHHHNERTEVYYVTHGQLEVELNDVKYSLSEGKAITIPKGQTHQVVNTSGNTAELVVSCTPSWIYSDSIVDALPPVSKADPYSTATVLKALQDSSSTPAATEDLDCTNS